MIGAEDPPRRCQLEELGSFLALWPEAETWGREGVEIIRQHGVGVPFEPLLLTFWAESLAARGQSEGAQGLIDEAMGESQPFVSSWIQVRTHLGQGSPPVGET